MVIDSIPFCKEMLLIAQLQEKIAQNISYRFLKEVEKRQLNCAETRAYEIVEDLKKLDLVSNHFQSIQAIEHLLDLEISIEKSTPAGIPMHLAAFRDAIIPAVLNDSDLISSIKENILFLFDNSKKIQNIDFWAGEINICKRYMIPRWDEMISQKRSVSSRNELLAINQYLKHLVNQKEWISNADEMQLLKHLLFDEMDGTYLQPLNQ